MAQAMRACLLARATAALFHDFECYNDSAHALLCGIDNASIMAECESLPGPIMGARAGFHGDHSGRRIGEELRWAPLSRPVTSGFRAMLISGVWAPT